MENEEKITAEVEKNGAVETQNLPDAADVAETAPAEDAKPNFFKNFIRDFINYFKNFDATRIMHWCQVVFVAVLTVVLTNASLRMFYESAKSRLSYEQYFEKNKSLMVSYTVCAAMTFIFLGTLVAWGIGKLLRKRFKKWFEN